MTKFKTISFAIDKLLFEFQQIAKGTSYDKWILNSEIGKGSIRKRTRSTPLKLVDKEARYFFELVALIANSTAPIDIPTAKEFYRYIDALKQSCIDLLATIEKWKKTKRDPEQSFRIHSVYGLTNFVRAIHSLLKKIDPPLLYEKVLATELANRAKHRAGFEALDKRLITKYTHQRNKQDKSAQIFLAEQILDYEMKELQRMMQSELYTSRNPQLTTKLKQILSEQKITVNNYQRIIKILKEEQAKLASSPQASWVKKKSSNGKKKVSFNPSLTTIRLFTRTPEEKLLHTSNAPPSPRIKKLND